MWGTPRTSCLRSGSTARTSAHSWPPSSRSEPPTQPLLLLSEAPCSGRGGQTHPSNALWPYPPHRSHHAWDLEEKSAPPRVGGPGEGHGAGRGWWTYIKLLGGPMSGGLPHLRVYECVRTCVSHWPLLLPTSPCRFFSSEQHKTGKPIPGEPPGHHLSPSLSAFPEWNGSWSRVPVSS